MAKDGIELQVRVKVTVKTNIDTLIGGAGEDTVLARVGEGVVTTVGSANSHTQVLENPDIISKMVFKKGLDKLDWYLHTTNLFYQRPYNERLWLKKI